LRAHGLAGNAGTGIAAVEIATGTSAAIFDRPTIVVAAAGCSSSERRFVIRWWIGQRWSNGRACSSYRAANGAKAMAEVAITVLGTTFRCRHHRRRLLLLLLLLAMDGRVRSEQQE
jgi:hypothetical protein